MKYTLGKEERLKSRKLIGSLYEEGKSIKAFPLIMVYIQTEHTSDYPCQVGVSVPKRNFKKAVDRNRIKRLMREAYRLQKNHLQEMLKAQQRGLILFFNYTSREMPEYPTVFEGIQKCLSKLVKTFHEKGIADT